MSLGQRPQHRVGGIRFFVPGTTTAAAVKGFGVVVTSVDRAGTTRLKFLDQSGKVIFVAFAPRGPGPTRASRSWA